MTVAWVAANTDDLAAFVRNGERHVANLQAIYEAVDHSRRVASSILDFDPPSASPVFAELIAESVNNNSFVRRIDEELRQFQTTVGPIVGAPGWLIDRRLDGSGFDGSGADLPLGEDVQLIDLAIAASLADGDLAHARALREIKAAALVADGRLAGTEKETYDGLVIDGVPAYASWLRATMTAEQISDQLRADVYAEAGIDNWNPARGVDFNRQNIDAVYTYYPKLFAIDPDMYWLGLASIAAPQFYASFLDIKDMRERVELGQGITEVMREVGTPEPLLAELADISADETAAALWFLETTFLRMQQGIFNDIAVQHYAYQVGGMTLIESFADGSDTVANSDRAAEVLGAWRHFEAGDYTASTEAMVDREQRQIIQGDYDNIWNFSHATKVFVTAAGLTAADPSGGESFFSYTITPRQHLDFDVPDLPSVKTPDVPPIDTPRVPLPLPLPFPVWIDPAPLPGLDVPDIPGFETPDIDLSYEGIDLTANVANEDDRMHWIKGEVTPNVIRRARTDMDGLLAQSQLDLHVEVEKARLVPRQLR